MRNYQQFVDAGAGIERAPWEHTVGQLLIGSEAWTAKMRTLIESSPRSNDYAAAHRFAGRPRPSKVIEVVASVFEGSPEQIRTTHGTVERKVVAWLGCYESMSRLGEIATVLRLRSTSRVASLIKACQRDLASDRNLRIAVDRCIDLLRVGLEPARTVHRESFPGTQRMSF